MNKFSGSCNNINDSYAKLYIPNVAKNLNVEVFNLMQERMKQGTQNGMKLVNVNAD